MQQKSFVLTKESRAVRISGETITTYRNIQTEHDGHEIILPKVSQLSSQSSVLFLQSQDDSIEEFILPFISSDSEGNQTTSHHSSDSQDVAARTPKPREWFAAWQQRQSHMACPSPSPSVTPYMPALVLFYIRSE